MGYLVRRLTACVLACGLATPGVASVFASGAGADHSPCERPSAGGCANGLLLASAGDLAGLGLSAQPLPRPLSTPAPSAEEAARSARHLRITEIASFVGIEAVPGAATGAAAPALFWVFGSGLLGAAFIARRRKPARRKR